MYSFKQSKILIFIISRTQVFQQLKCSFKNFFINFANYKHNVDNYIKKLIFID